MSARAARQRLASQVEPMRNLEKLIRETAYRHPVHQVFRDFCEMAATALSNGVDLSPVREKREARYLDIVKRYDKVEIDRFAQMLACLVAALEDELHDAMGKLFMALELGNHWVGQFFTPYSLALLMAKMQLHDAAELVKARGYITVCEPAAGAGGMVIACAQALRDLGLNYQTCMHATAQDLDETAALMCYLQMSLLHIPGVVAVGDTLRMETRDVWYTPAHVMGGWSMRLRARERAEGGEAAPVVEVAAVPKAAPAAPQQPAREPGLGQLDLFGGAA